MSKPIACPHCGKKYAIDERYQGKIVRCRGCRKRFEIDIAASVGLVVLDEDQADSVVSMDSGGESSANSVGDGSTIAGGNDGTDGRDLSIGDGATVLGHEVGTQNLESAIPSFPLSSKYELIRELGRGGMGVVHLARDVSLNRKVAIKGLLSGTQTGDRVIARFLSEARSIAKLAHPNIVGIYEFFRDADGNGRLHIAMEYVEGQDLANVLHDRNKLPQQEAVTLLRGICDGLQHAHERGVLHRDIKPSNILLPDDGLPKLVDFGLAKLQAGAASTRTGALMGTSLYMAPEQMTDSKHVDQRADIYALGKTLFQMVTGQLPQSTDLDEVPEALRPILRKMLKSDPTLRYFSVRDVAIELGDIADGVHGTTTIGKKPYSQPATGPLCKGCGAGISLEESYCGECGRELKIDFSRYCPQCGKDEITDKVFCRKCGSKLLTGKYRDKKYREQADDIINLVADYHLPNVWDIVDRAQAIVPVTGRYLVSIGPNGKDLVVLDNQTKLTWTKEYWEGKTLEEAVALCDSLTYAGHNDWRLPTKDELVTLLDSSICEPPHSTFPDMPSTWFWSSSCGSDDPDDYAWDYAWYVHFGFGLAGNCSNSNDYAARYVRPWRNQSDADDDIPF